MVLCRFCKDTGTIGRLHIGKAGKISIRKLRCLNCRPLKKKK